MKRRMLLRLLGLTSLNLFSSKLFGQNQRRRKTFPHSGRDIVLDESGLFGQTHFVLGILICPSATQTMGAIGRFRTRSKYRRTLGYHSRDRYKAAYAKALIDYWLDSSDIQVRIRAIKRTTTNKKEKAGDEGRRYAEQIIGLLNTRSRTPNTSRVVTQPRNLRADVKRAWNIQEIKEISQKESDLIQLLGLIVGTVYGSYEGSDRKPTNKTKNEIRSYLQNKLGKKSLWSSIQHPRLSIEVLPEA